MPRLHLNRTGGARRAVAYLGVSEHSTDDAERSQKRALREKKKLIREAAPLAQTTDCTDWKSASEQLSTLQRRWKAAGWAGLDDDERLWKRFKAHLDEFHRRRTAHFDELNRLYASRVEERIQRHREAIGKLRSLRRELTLRRQSAVPDWVGAGLAVEMAEEFDERIEGIEESIAERENWLEQDLRKLDHAQDQL
jgi:Domain of Unknown Function (DUF349)